MHAVDVALEGRLNPGRTRDLGCDAVVQGSVGRGTRCGLGVEVVLERGVRSSTSRSFRRNRRGTSSDLGVNGGLESRLGSRCTRDLGSEGCLGGGLDDEEGVLVDDLRPDAGAVEILDLNGTGCVLEVECQRQLGDGHDVTTEILGRDESLGECHGGLLEDEW